MKQGRNHCKPTPQLSAYHPDTSWRPKRTKDGRRSKRIRTTRDLYRRFETRTESYQPSTRHPHTSRRPKRTKDGHWNKGIRRTTLPRRVPGASHAETPPPRRPPPPAPRDEAENGVSFFTRQVMGRLKDHTTAGGLQDPPPGTRLAEARGVGMGGWAWGGCCFRAKAASLHTCRRRR